MGLIEKLIELAEGHPRPLLLTLLGVIIVGSTGGGIWISNLQSSVEERDKIISERLSLQEHQFRRDLRIRSEEIVILKEEVESLRSGIERIEATVVELSSLLDSSQGRKYLESGELTRLASALEVQRKDLELALIKADAAVSIAERLAEEVLPTPRLAGAGRTGLLLVLVLLGLFVTLITLFFLRLWYIRSSELLRLRRELAFQEGESIGAQPHAAPDDDRAEHGRLR